MKIQSLAVLGVLLGILSSSLGCGVISPFRDIVIKAETEANAGNFIPINIVVPIDSRSQAKLEEYVENVEGWFQLAPDSKEQLVRFVANGNIDPRELRDKSTFTVPHDKDLIHLQSHSWVVIVPENLRDKALASGLYVWVRYSYGSSGDMLDGQGKTDYCGRSYIRKDALEGGGPIVISLKKTGMDINL